MFKRQEVPEFQAELCTLMGATSRVKESLSWTTSMFVQAS